MWAKLYNMSSERLEGAVFHLEAILHVCRNLIESATLSHSGYDQGVGKASNKVCDLEK